MEVEVEVEVEVPVEVPRRMMRAVRSMKTAWPTYAPQVNIFLAPRDIIQQKNKIDPVSYPFSFSDNEKLRHSFRLLCSNTHLVGLVLLEQQRRYRQQMSQPIRAEN